MNTKTIELQKLKNIKGAKLHLKYFTRVSFKSLFQNYIHRNDLI